MTVDAAHPLLTPWSLAVFLVALAVIYAPHAVVWYEAARRTTIPGSRVWNALARHAVDTILVCVAVAFAVWRFEHGASLALAAQPFLAPAVWIAGRLLRRRRRRRAEGAPIPPPRGR